MSYTESQQQIHSTQTYKPMDRLYSTDVTKKNILEIISPMVNYNIAIGYYCSFTLLGFSEHFNLS